LWDKSLFVAVQHRYISDRPEYGRNLLQRHCALQKTGFKSMISRIRVHVGMHRAQAHISPWVRRFFVNPVSAGRGRSLTDIAAGAATREASRGRSRGTAAFPGMWAMF
jgi:hypothetical protein